MPTLRFPNTPRPHALDSCSSKRMLPDHSDVLARVRERLELVNILAHRMRRDLGGAVPVEDLVSYGNEGLLSAARTFDASLGVPFGCWATLRIRGSMIDGLRQSGSLPRRVYRRARAAPSSLESARSADAQLGSRLEGLATAMALRVVGAAARELHDEARARSRTPEALVGEAELLRTLEHAISRLPARERRLIERHYFDDVGLNVAARELNLSKSWGSRLHARAIGMLARDLKRSTRARTA